MKKIMTLMFVTIFGIVTNVGCLHAGHRRGNNFVEGAIIGAGAAILGAAIISEINSPPRNHYIYVDRESRQDRYERERRHRDNVYESHDRYDRHDRYDKPDNNSYDRDDRRDRGGYWSVERVWVPPIYRQRWNPGHYNGRGHWVPGEYDRVIIREGYWDTKKIWVSN